MANPSCYYAGNLQWELTVDVWAATNATRSIFRVRDWAGQGGARRCSKRQFA